MPFQKGNKYGKGRPPGFLSRLSLIDETFGREGLRKLYELLYEKAMGGDLKASELILSGIPQSKYKTYINVDAIIDMKSLVDVNRAATDTMNEVGAGTLSLEDGAETISLIEKRGMIMAAVENAELEKENAELSQ